MLIPDSLLNTMPCLGNILVYGHDANLLEIRGLILKKAGFNVWAAANSEDAAILALCQKIDVFILCHTLSKKECAAALDMAQSRRPAMKMVILTTRQSIVVRGKNFEFLSTFDGPAALVATAIRLLPDKTADGYMSILALLKEKMLLR
jgi:hypothetical protein